MMMKHWTLQQIADHINADIIGDSSIQISGLKPLASAEPGDISFLCDAQYAKQLPNTRAAAVVLAASHAKQCPSVALVVDNPSIALVHLLRLLFPQPDRPAGIHASAVIADSCDIDASVSIGPNVVIDQGVSIGSGCVISAGCVLGPGVTLGQDCLLHANVTLMPGARMGDRCILHPGAVIGSDGFGNAMDQQHRWVKIPQVGGVVIGDDVEVGANTTIDCGALEDTVIGNGVRLDNQIQIAHNVRIGDHTAVAGCVGIAGSTEVGKHCMIGGGVCINGHLSICDGVIITGMAMVTRSITEPGLYSSGLPVSTNKQWHRQVARIKQLDNMAKRIAELERGHHG